MTFNFKAKIYKVGINPCVAVPKRISDKMKPIRGYIPIKGKIDGHAFKQTLVPIKNDGYRLYVNGPMLKGSGLSVGDMAHFSIGQNFVPRKLDYPMLPELRKRLNENQLMEVFKSLIPSRQLEVLRYLNHLKTDESRIRNMNQVILSLQKKSTP